MQEWVLRSRFQVFLSLPPLTFPRSPTSAPPGHFLRRTGGLQVTHFSFFIPSPLTPRKQQARGCVGHSWHLHHHSSTPLVSVNPPHSWFLFSKVPWSLSDRSVRYLSESNLAFSGDPQSIKTGLPMPGFHLYSLRAQLPSHKCSLTPGGPKSIQRGCCYPTVPAEHFQLSSSQNTSLEDHWKIMDPFLHTSTISTHSCWHLHNIYLPPDFLQGITETLTIRTLIQSFHFAYDKTKSQGKEET